MASSFYLLLIATVALLLTPALSQSCKPLTISHTNITLANCTNLPTLKASIHWSYDPAAKPKPTLSVAFTAPPAKPDGWVAWALNPTGTGMVGSQALVAFKAANGSMAVKTYNISSYGPISESKIAYDVLSKSAEASKGTITIYATLALPAAAAELNQVWQVGSAVMNGVPAKHEFAPENLNSKSALQLVSAAKNGGAPAPAPSVAAAPGPGGNLKGNDSSGSLSVRESGMGVYGVSVLLAGFIFGF